MVYCVPSRGILFLQNSNAFPMDFPIEFLMDSSRGILWPQHSNTVAPAQEIYGPSKGFTVAPAKQYSDPNVAKLWSQHRNTVVPA